MDKMDRIMEITNRYLERFGRALIGIYYLPPLVENWKFTVFINSLLVTLRRMDLMPGYCWFVDANEGHYLIRIAVITPLSDLPSKCFPNRRQTGGVYSSEGSK